MPLSEKPGYEELAQQVDYLNAMVSAMPQPMALISRDYTCLMVNNAFSALYGITAEKAVENTVEDIFGRNIFENQIKPCLDRCLKGEMVNFEWDFDFPGHTSRLLDVFCQPCRGKDKEIRGVVFRAVDITERRQAEDTLRENELFFRQVIDVSPNCIFVKNFNGQYVLVNEAISTLYNVPKEKMLGKTDYELAQKGSLTHEESESFLAHDRAVIKTKKTRHISAEQFTLADGTTKWFQTVKVPLDFEFLPDCMLGVAADITEHKQAEAERARLMSAVEQAVEMFVITDVNGTILYVNPAFERITGYPVNEAIGSNPRILKSGKQDQSFYRTLWQTILAGNSWQGRMTNKKKDGTEYLEEMVISPVLDGNGKTVNFVAVKRDITEDVRLAENLHQAQKMESIGSLAGGIAHDFNNILFPIVALSEMMLEDFDSTSMAYQNINEIYKAGQRGSALVQQILSFSRQSEFKEIPVMIQSVLKEVLKLCRSTIPMDIDISRDIQKDCGMVKADPIQIHQVAMNLITNAFHAVEEAGGSISVQLREKKVSSEEKKALQLNCTRCALLSVLDTGRGIDPDVADKIFDPYFTTKKKGKGTGLGLATVYAIVKKYNGAIKFTSEPGKGTRFFVYFPLMDKLTDTQHEQDKGEDMGGNERILLVDDEHPVVQLEKQVLERLGYTVTAFTDSSEAFKAFETDPDAFDLVLTDMAMPKMSGDLLARKIFEIKPDMPIILCTGFSERIDHERAEKIGIKGLLMKPVVRSEMAGKIRQVLDSFV